MRTYQAKGGTNRHGVPAEAFAMPPGMRMRYDVPSAALTACVTGYAIYIGDSHEPMVNWYLPAPAIISILLDAGRVEVTMRNRTYSAVDQATLYGPTSRAFRTITHGGIAIGIGLTAAGWARLTATSASRHLDKLTPLEQVAQPDLVAGIVEALSGLQDDAHIGPTLDRTLPALFRRPCRNEDRIRKLEVCALVDGITSVAEIAARLSIEAHNLRTLSSAAFGMPPKLLASRSRFLRSMTRWLGSEEPTTYEGVVTGYHDVSHFLRDAQTYLGMTPRRFAAGGTVYLQASLKARMAVMGTPTHALHPGDCNIGFRPVLHYPTPVPC